MKSVMLVVVVVIFIKDGECSSNDPSLNTRAGNQLRDIPSVYGRVLSKCIRYRGRIALQNYTNDFTDIFGTTGSLEFWGGYMLTDIGNINCGSIKGTRFGTQVPFVFRCTIDTIRIVYNFKYTTRNLDIGGTIKANLYKVFIIVKGTAVTQAERCIISSYGSSELHLEPRQYDYDLECLDFRWWNAHTVRAILITARDTVWRCSEDRYCVLFKNTETRVFEALKSIINAEAWTMLIKEAHPPYRCLPRSPCRIPTIFLDAVGDWLHHADEMKARVGDNFQATFRGKQYRLQANSIETFRRLQRYLLNKAKLFFHTFDVGGCRNLKVIISGLPADVTAEGLQDALTADRFAVADCTKLRTSRGLTRLWLVSLIPDRFREDEDTRPV